MLLDCFPPYTYWDYRRVSAENLLFETVQSVPSSFTPASNLAYLAPQDNFLLEPNCSFGPNAKQCFGVGERLRIVLAHLSGRFIGELIV